MAQMQLEAATEQQVLLVVDDREENLVAMEALLGDGQWNVRTVDSGEAALRCLMEEDVGLVLLDVQMPKMDGFEVARLMRGSPHTRHTPIIFLSAIAHTEDSVLQGYAVGAVDFILKPFDPKVLKHKIGALLEQEKSLIHAINSNVGEMSRLAAKVNDSARHAASEADTVATNSQALTRQTQHFHLAPPPRH